jgi:KDO2-lipid IV(A) lauroyltransferase
MSKAKKIRRKIRYAVVYRFVQFLMWLSAITPRQPWLRFCGVLGGVAYYFAGKTRKLTQKHLAIAFPEKNSNEITALSKRVFKFLGKNAGEMLRASATLETLEDLDKILVVHGFENFEKARDKNKGVIFLTCHLGAFDLQVTVMALRGLNPNIIGTPLKDPRLNELLWRYRNKHGAIAIERGRETFKMLKILKSAGSIALLIDQDTKVKSRFVNFFGKPAATPVGATVLAMKTGASIVPTYIYLGEDGMQHMTIMPEVELRNTGNEEDDMVFNTQVLTSINEAQIRQHPEQWVWMHERWKTKPGQEIQ